MKTIATLLQARMSSKRLPGKVLMPLHGKPVLQRVMERIQLSARPNPVIVATSTAREDDPIAEFCTKKNYLCRRGDLGNVAKRFHHILQEFQTDAFIRISADSPLIDPHIIDRAVDLFESQDSDLVTNIYPRSYPRGQSVEIVKRSTFLETFPRMTDPDDQEHVTSFFYKHAKEYKITSLKASHEYPPLHFALDTPQDFEALNRLFSAMGDNPNAYGLDEIVALHARTLASQQEER